MVGPNSSLLCPDCGAPLANHVCPNVPVMTMPPTVIGRVGSRMIGAIVKPACALCSKPGGHHNGTAIETAIMCLWRQWEQATQGVSPDARNTTRPFNLDTLRVVQNWAEANGITYQGQGAAPRGRPKKLQATASASNPAANARPTCQHGADPGSCGICAAIQYAPQVTMDPPAPASAPYTPMPNAPAVLDADAVKAAMRAMRANH